MVQNEIEKIVRLQRHGYGYKLISQMTRLPQNTVKSYCRRHPFVCAEGEDTPRCRQCGKPVEQTPHRKLKLFCSDACRMAWWNSHPERVKRGSYHAAMCASCGCSFEYYGGTNRKFCSRTCYAVYRRREVR